MNGSVFVGNRALSINKIGEYAQITGVRLWVDDENVYEAGDESGVVLEANCPYATQEIANSVLSNVQGYQYKPVTATGAEVSPTAELGDAVTIGDTYTQLAKQNVRFSTGAVMDVSAPGSSEVDHEYKTEGAQTQQTNRKLAETRSLISKTAEEIQMLVESEIEDLSASITVSLNGINQRIDGMDNQFAEIDLSLGGITSTVNGLDGKITQVDQKVDSITLNVSNGSTSSTISLLVDGVTVSSKSITMSGLVTFTGLANGTTTINGGCIKTGTIDADRLNLTGAITFNDLSYSVQNDINDAYAMAQDAEDMVNGWKDPYSTYIDGSKIETSELYVNAANITGTLRAGELIGSTVGLVTSANRDAGWLSITGASTSTYAIELGSNGALRLTSGSGQIHLENDTSRAFLGTWDSEGIRAWFTENCAPRGSDQWNCGTIDYKWANVYAVNGTIQTSDANQKEDVEDLPEKYIDLVFELVPKRYKMKTGQSGRYHTGFIAQDVKLLMEKYDISNEEFGAWCQEIGKDGTVYQMLRYDELIPLLLGLAKRLFARIGALEEKLNA